MTRHETASALLFLAALAVYLTWPQALHLGSGLVRHDDPYFSTWRLAWIAHALSVDPHHLYDANIFYPEPRTLAYSDATLLEGALGAPLIWAGLKPIAVYNLLLLTGIGASGIGMLVLVQHLTSNSRAALVAAAIYTLLPYRLEHVMHLELQWTVWIPLAWWALHRTFETGLFRWGLLTGLFIWLQLLSCVYYGVFLGLTTAVMTLLMIADRRGRAWRGAMATAAGAAIAIPLSIVAARPYIANTRHLGPRSVEEISRFSATAMSYFSAPFTNVLWGATANRFTGNELHLFPGLVGVMLAAVALARTRRRSVWLYAGIGAFGVVMSLGEHAIVYSWLRQHVYVLSGFRAAARFSIIAFAAMAVLGGLGYEWLESTLPRPSSAAALMVACLVALGLEATPAPLRLASIPPRAPDVYVMLRQLPAAPIVEFPSAEPSWIPGFDAVYMFWSTTHWRPLVNGYSGYVSEAYVGRLEQLEDFPDDASIALLERLGVRYVIVHEGMYESRKLPALLLRIAETPALMLVGRYRDFEGKAQLFELRPPARP